LLNDSCPGVSIMSKPGIRSSASTNCTMQWTKNVNLHNKWHTHTCMQACAWMHTCREREIQEETIFSDDNIIFQHSVALMYWFTHLFPLLLQLCLHYCLTEKQYWN
jgi:hypothetical protein